MENDILISVVIPVKDGEIWIEKCLKAIINQTLFYKTEIIIIDSGSSDKTLNIIANYPVRLIEIPSHEFNHGLTRNLGVKESKGEFVVMTVQDAVASDVYWLQKLLDGFIDYSVVAVCGRQIVPHYNKYNPMDWYRPSSPPVIRKIYFENPDNFYELSTEERKRACSWDNVTAMYRKKNLLGLPFQKTVFAEDMIWAKSALVTGNAIVYNPNAQVEHYHFEDKDYVFKRVFTTIYYRYKIIGYKPIAKKNIFRSKLSIVKHILLTRDIGISKKIYWIFYNFSRLKVENNVYDFFLKALSKGEDQLDALHEKICGVPPTPLKKA